MPTTLPTVLTLPGRVDSSLLAKHQRAGEPVILIKLVGVGNTAPYDFRDKGTRSYIFRFDSQMEGHLLRIPLHLWQENKARLAHDIMDQRHLTHSMIVMLEQPPAPKPATSQSRPETGATDTSTNALNVVGSGQEPTVAPTSAAATEKQPATPAVKSTSAAVTEKQPATPAVKSAAAVATAADTATPAAKNAAAEALIPAMKSTLPAARRKAS